MTTTAPTPPPPAPLTTMQRAFSGGRGFGRPLPRVRCADGFTVSAQAGPGFYCTPRPSVLPGHPVFADDVPHDYPGPYTEVEVGFPSARPEPWGDAGGDRDGTHWAPYCEDPDKPTGTVYGNVPTAMVEALVALHGGEVA